MLTPIGLFGCFVFLLFVTDCSPSVFRLEAEDAHGEHTKTRRNAASNGEAVLIERAGETLFLNFCLRETTQVKVKNIRFSNDGDGDLVFVHIDDDEIGRVFTSDQHGNGVLWEVFDDTGPINSGVLRAEGWHVLKLFFPITDGVEIDFIEFEVGDQKITIDLFTCKLTCVQNERSSITTGFELRNITFGQIRQQSYPTSCAEEENVNIPIFHHTVKEFAITATHPAYKTFSNWREKNTTDCSFIPPLYWKFTNVKIAPNENSKSNKKARLRFKPGWRATSFSAEIHATFQIDGRKRGLIDSEVGSHLTIRLKNLVGKAVIGVNYMKRPGGYSRLQTKTFKAQTVEHTWKIPDFTWSEDDENSIKIYVDSSSQVIFDEIRLERRPVKGETVHSVFKGDDIVVEAVEVDFWWMAPNYMHVIQSLDGTQFNNIAFLRVYRPVPWKKGFNQVFVLYQDGNVRILPLTPPGIDWIPFGSSVIIGQTNPTDFRPRVSISTAEVNPRDKSIFVLYHDGGSVTLKLDSSITETTLHVTDINYVLDTSTHPFATFRSMYVSDVINDASHLTTTGKDIYHLSEAWAHLPGITFQFFRKCMSKHLTQSPDIRIDILKDNGTSTSAISAVNGFKHSTDIYGSLDFNIQQALMKFNNLLQKLKDSTAMVS